MNNNFNQYDGVPSNFCLMPYVHKAIDGNGDFKPCCVADNHLNADGTTANINFIDFDSFIKSKEVADFKQLFKDNQRSELCNNCWRFDDQNGESHRKRYMTFFMNNQGWGARGQSLHNTFEKFFNKEIPWDQVQAELDSIETPWDLEIEPGTTCNFKCHFCGPHASSSWIADEKALYGTTAEQAARATKMGHWALDSELWLSEVMYEGDKFHFMGGEPMLINAHFKFLNKLSQRADADSIFISYNTNASTLPPEETLNTVYKKFKAVRVAFSIDAIEDRFHYQRYPGIWAEAESNMSTWVEAIRDNIEAKVDPGWSILNLLYMGELFLWADAFKKKHNLNDRQFDFDGHYYFGPYYCPQSLTVEQKQQFAKKMTADIEMLRSAGLDRRMMQRAEIAYKNMLDHMMARDTWTEETEQRRQHRILGLDRIRNQSLKTVEPELNTILKLYE